MNKILLLCCLTFNIEAIDLKFNNYENLELTLQKKITTIAQDKTGYLWIGSDEGLFRYNAYKFEPIDSCNKFNLKSIKKIYVDSKNYIWISSKNNGLFKYSNGDCNSVELGISNVSLSIYDIDEDSDQNLLFSTSDGLYELKNNSSIIEKSRISIPQSQPINSLIIYKKNTLIFTIEGKVFLFNSLQNKYKVFYIPDKEHFYIYDFVVDDNDALWIGSNANLFHFNLKTEKFSRKGYFPKDTRIPSLAIEKNNLWVATTGLGLVKIDLNTLKSANYRNNKNNLFSIKENTLVSLFITRDKTLWIGGFFQGLSSIDLSTIEFNHKVLDCTNNRSFRSAILDRQGNIWLGSDNGIITYNEKSKKCQFIEFENNKSHNSINYLSLIDNEIWFLNSKNIEVIDIYSNEITKISKLDCYPNKLAFDDVNKIIYISCNSRLFKMDVHSNTIEEITVQNNENKLLKINDINVYKERVLVATNHGLAKINSNGHLKFYNNSNSNFTAIYQGLNSTIVAVLDNGLFNFDNENLVPIFVKENLPEDTYVNGIIKVSDDYWLSTNKGLAKINSKEKTTHLFNYNEGTYNNFFYANSSFLGDDGKLFFGGKNGYIYFHPKDIKIKKKPTTVVIDNLYSLDQRVEINKPQSSGLQIDRPINEIDELLLNYKDYIIGFDFIVLEFANPSKVNYAYRLKGFKGEWVNTDSNNRRVTYTNLKPGTYTFQVKASNNEGVWSDQPKELKVIVSPAPWFSPWAYFTYFIIAVISIWAFIRYKTIASRKRAKQLEATVAERTQEVSLQKKMVQSLLDHKNEVFANITHEFKTPLALILGPIEQLVKEPELAPFSDKLVMVQRNAKRLILMVGQILKLSQAEQDKEIIRKSQSVQPILLMLYESFLPLGFDKNVKITIDNHQDVNIYGTSECLEIVVGNLLSNALKFTNAGGGIHMQAEVVKNKIEISVRDTGTGIESKYLDKIFKRFTRIDMHKRIAGTGIGLSVVKELTEANDGQVKVNSKWGKGSLFTVIFPVSEVVDESLLVENIGSNDLVGQLVENTQNELKAEQTHSKSTPNKNNVSILIIEDNLDMQTHIGNVLNERFNCYFADRGRDGIAIALKEVPDIVICDVMMPGMDGYKVTRILRHDGRTSHIPIVLLTALNTTESRIKGWRENIDIYVTKPFDSIELNAQLDNILIIRKMLQQKNNKMIKNNDSLNTLDLPKKDLEFIEKFKDVIGQYFGNEYFQKADLASKMAVSERQLHRKLKALIDENPMDMLRDYRLEKAAMKLKGGYQVGIVSDECGFSSVSYLGRCFKKKYGITPKQYQMLKSKC